MCDRGTILKKWPRPGVIQYATEFLSQLAVAATEEHDHGISWIELTVLYETREPTPIPKDLGQPNKPTNPHDKPVPFYRVTATFFGTLEETSRVRTRRRAAQGQMDCHGCQWEQDENYGGTLVHGHCRIHGAPRLQ